MCITWNKKGHRSDFNRGIYREWKGVFMRKGRGTWEEKREHLLERKRGTCKIEGAVITGEKWHSWKMKREINRRGRDTCKIKTQYLWDLNTGNYERWRGHLTKVKGGIPVPEKGHLLEIKKGALMKMENWHLLQRKMGACRRKRDTFQNKRGTCQRWKVKEAHFLCTLSLIMLEYFCFTPIYGII